MGQKINPLVFRFSSCKNYHHYHSFYFCNNSFFFNLTEDKKLKTYIKQIIGIKNNNNLFKITIYKKKNLIFIKIFLIKFSRFIIIKRIQKIKFNFNFLNIYYLKVKRPYEHSKIISNFVIYQYKNNVSFLKIIKKLFFLLMTTTINVKGIRINISGKIDNKDISRIEWIKTGKISLNTITNKIDYSSCKIKNKYGLVGLKVFLNKY
nr:ribosomal protein S3 [Thonningia sanguinea]WJE89178.1 ribosomal protein S3 [Thonningia sanguinea]